MLLCGIGNEQTTRASDIYKYIYAPEHEILVSKRKQEMEKDL
jgi:hypothetical protein